MDLQNRITAELITLPATVNAVDYRKRGYHLEVLLEAERLRDFALLMRRFDFYLSFVTAVHLDPEMELVYQFASYQEPCRTLVRLTAPPDGPVPTISDIYHGANWHERETWEMYGVIFAGHPFLKPLLLPEEATELKPLRKAPPALKTSDKVRRVEE
ncbi:MAG TPA: NADH-quinone oxidoreductase subunit C [Geobacteraceae bacterium]|nr:NADH-quinone oxidoreductase subunit C [Geobacteraceae bacterium]